MDTPIDTTIPVPVIAVNNHNSLGKLLNKPTEYDGKDRNACTTFIAQLRLYILGNSQLFQDDMQKVLFSATYLRGKAFAWMEPRLNRTVLQEPMLGNFNLFCEEMIRNLGDPDREKSLSKKINNLTQVGSTANYRTEFDNLAQFLTWDDSALRSRFYEGLKSDVKDALSYVPIEPILYRDFQDLCVRLDNRIYDRKSEHKKQPTTQTHKSNTSTSRHNNPKPAYSSSSSNYYRTNTGPAPMDLDATKNRKFKPLTPEERQQRMTNNLCMYCGKPGHRAAECPAKTKRTGYIRATMSLDSTPGSSDPKN